jgi:hypothetical protein
MKKYPTRTIAMIVTPARQLKLRKTDRSTPHNPMNARTGRNGLNAHPPNVQPMLT